MSILVTGGHGFLGSHLVRELESRGYSIIAPTHQECNLLNRDEVSTLLSNNKPSTIIHLAARVGGIGANQKYPGTFLYENLQMGINLIDEANKIRELERFLLIGTICSYPKLTQVPFKEEDLWKGYPEETNAPYGIAKKALSEMGKAYHKQYGFPFSCLMPVNLYGPGDNFNPEYSHVIPALIKRLSEAKELNSPFVTIWGTGNATREFLYIKDAARGIASYLKIGNPDPVNLGAGFEISIRELSDLISSLVGYSGKIIWDTFKPDGQPRRCLDTTKMKILTGWEATTPLIEGLRESIDWYQKNED